MRPHKTLNVSLSFWLTIYSVLALGHFGHTHFYGRANPGYCTAQCHDPSHHNVKPQCKGFPVNLTMGVDAHAAIIPDQMPFYTGIYFKINGVEIEDRDRTDHSRAPPGADSKF